MKKTLLDEALKNAHQAGGSYKTRDQRMLHIMRFCHALKKMNIQIRAIAHVKARHILAYLAQRKAEGIGARTLQNEMASIRTVLREAGRARLADSTELSNEMLGLNGASRAGTKEAIPPEILNEKLKALANIDEGVAAIASLQLLLGLRAEEALKSFKMLSTWEKQNAAGLPLRVIFGTKGGRPRDVHVVDHDAVAGAIQNAVRVTELRGGLLVNRAGEKAAMFFYSRTMRNAGFVGRYSGHALRYAFAQARISAYLEQGYSRKEALAMTSCDLGHGDGRGRYITHVYARKT